jgi:hypothetical protein
MGQALLDQHDDQPGRARLREQFSAIHESLGQGCAQRSAEVLLRLAQ